ncbi:hypothetical protein CYMTET_34681 [Cymbomonas tetramitiformis]|uniref:Uncharacterized protein n=1 Tax=Cymbomonas tetramitiformis TaxID=36881 RepID=A0AAE0KPM4_9CHLO|nr:hypothetical protein CYMTET_34681 [Cymbomonas tetramitiformis]
MFNTTFKDRNSLSARRAYSVLQRLARLPPAVRAAKTAPQRQLSSHLGTWSKYTPSSQRQGDVVKIDVLLRFTRHQVQMLALGCQGSPHNFPQRRWLVFEHVGCAGSMRRIAIHGALHPSPCAYEFEIHDCSRLPGPYAAEDRMHVIRSFSVARSVLGQVLEVETSSLTEADLTASLTSIVNTAIDANSARVAALEAVTVLRREDIEDPTRFPDVGELQGLQALGARLYDLRHYSQRRDQAASCRVRGENNVFMEVRSALNLEYQQLIAALLEESNDSSLFGRSDPLSQYRQVLVEKFQLR